MKTETYAERSLRLTQRFEGVSEPEQMGTTGLIGWVLMGGSHRTLYRRVRRAVKVLKGRGLNIDGFCRTVMAEEPNRATQESLMRYFKLAGCDVSYVPAYHDR